MEYFGQFYSGAHSVEPLQFLTIEDKQLSRTSSLWGPGEPSGNGSCGTLFLRKKEWRVYVDSCHVNIAFVCQKRKNTSGKKTNV